MITAAGSAVAAAEPQTCEVPAVMNAAGDTQVRPAVTYYTIGPDLLGATASGGLAAESDDGTSKWTATVVLNYATSAENAESSVQSHPRTKAGEVAWYTGDLRRAQWVENMRSREQTFWGSVDTARSTALGVAT